MGTLGRADHASANLLSLKEPPFHQIDKYHCPLTVCHTHRRVNVCIDCPMDYTSTVPVYNIIAHMVIHI